MLSADDARVEVGNRHRRGADGGLAVDLGMMALVQAGVVAAQPDAAHRKSAVASAFWNAGFLQQRQRTAAGPKIDEPGRGRALRVADGALEVQAPASVRRTSDPGDVMGVVDREAVETLQIADEIARERTVVHVS